MPRYQQLHDEDEFPLKHPAHAHHASVEYEPSTKDETSSFKSTDPAHEKLSLWAAIRKWPKLALWSFALSSTILLYGFDSVLVSSVSSMPVFQEVYGEAFEDKFIIPSMWMALWAIAGPIGKMPGSLLGGWLADRIGRKKMFWITTGLAAGAVAIFFFSDVSPDINARRGVFFVAKFIQGICIGALVATTQTYMSETVPHQLRGPILAFFPIFVLLGQVIGSIIIQVQMNVPGRTSYRVALATQWPFAIPPLLVGIFIPESPAWLLRHGQVEAARKSHIKLEGSKKDHFAPASFAQLQSTIARERQEKSGIKEYLACFQGTDRRRTTIVILAALIPDLFGLSLCGDAGYFLQTIGVDHSTSNLFFILGICLSLVANISSMWSLTRFGRRRLLLWSLGGCTILWLLMGISGFINIQSAKAVQYLAAVSLALVACVGSLGAWPASYVVSSEAPSMRLKAKSQGVGWFVSGGFSCGIGVGLPYVYNNDAGALGAKTGFVFVAFAGLATVLTWFLVPEMKGRSIEDVDRMFEIGLKTREFSNWQDEKRLTFEA